MRGLRGSVRRARRISRLRVAAAAVATVASALVASVTASAAPLAVTDVNPDSSIIDQNRNASQGGRVNGLKVAAGSNQVAYAATEWGGMFLNGGVTIRNSIGFVLMGDPGDLRCGGNTVERRSVLLENNAGGVEVSTNSVPGLTVNGTSGTGPFPESSGTEIERNRVLNNLSCSANAALPTNDGNPNQVLGTRVGQCSAPGF